MTTTDLSEYGQRELELLCELLEAMRDQGLPKDFYDNEVCLMMNKHSGYVFLTNSEFQVAMMNGDKMESFYTLPYSGYEGFIDDLYAAYEEGFIHHEEDIEALQYILKENGMNEEEQKIECEYYEKLW